MIIKKFQAKTEEEAMLKAKAELGDNVVLMNVKPDVKAAGIFGFFKGRLVEVTVAKEEEAEVNQKNQAELRSTIATVDKVRSQSEKTPVTDENINKKLDSITTLLKEKLDSPEPARSPLKNVEAVPEKKDLTEIPKDRENQDLAVNKEMLNLLKLLYNTMIDNEVNEKYANQMIEESQQVLSKNTNTEYILTDIYQKMILKFGKPIPISPAEKKPKVIYFIGPTGVGKTTTLAKLASNLSLLQKKKVALFTADTYRIAASNQLENYASILGAPFHVIYTHEEFIENYEKYRDFDYIMVDTAGHSHHNDKQKNEMNSFVHLLDGKAETEVYLVLSATTKYRDLLSIVDSYKELTDFRLIFTKLDETSGYGNLLNIRIYTDAPISYITNGQEVPSDIEVFNAQDTVKKILGGNHQDVSSN